MESLNPPLVSVIIPTYNRAHLLPRAVASVLAQTYLHWELIIVDDASTDDTADVVQSLSDPRVRYVRHETNLGGAAARNTGIDQAKGEFITFLDSDDFWIQNALDKQIKALLRASEPVGMVFVGWRRYADEGSEYDDRHPSAHGNITGPEFWAINTAMIAFMAETELIRRVGGFDPLMRSAQDTDLVLRLSRICRVTSVPDILLVSPPHEGAHITGNLDSLISGRQRFIDKHKDWLHATGRLHQWYRDLARYAILAGHRSIAYPALLKAIAEAPMKDKFELLPWFLLIVLGPRATRQLITAYRSLQ